MSFAYDESLYISLQCQFADLHFKTKNIKTLRNKSYSVQVRSYFYNVFSCFPDIYHDPFSVWFYQTTIFSEVSPRKCSMHLFPPNSNLYSIFNLYRMLDQIAVTRTENRSMMWDLRLPWLWLWTLLAPKYSKRVLSNTSCYDISYCLGNSIPFEIVLYDTTDVAVTFYRTLICSQKNRNASCF
jgi:hypothetical protein